MWRDEYGKYDMKIIMQCSKLIIQLYYIVQCSLDGDTNLSMVSGTLFLLCWAAIFKFQSEHARYRDGGRGRKIRLVTITRLSFQMRM